MLNQYYYQFQAKKYAWISLSALIPFVAFYNIAVPVSWAFTCVFAFSSHAVADHLRISVMLFDKNKLSKWTARFGILAAGSSTVLLANYFFSFGKASLISNLAFHSCLSSTVMVAGLKGWDIWYAQKLILDKLNSVFSKTRASAPNIDNTEHAHETIYKVGPVLIIDESNKSKAFIKNEVKAILKVAEKASINMELVIFSKSPQTNAHVNSLGHLTIHSGYFKKPFNRQMRMGVYGHELGHIANQDLKLSHLLSELFYYNAILLGMMSYNAYAAYIITYVATKTASYSHQCVEYLADLFSAEHTNPKWYIKHFEQLLSEEKHECNQAKSDFLDKAIAKGVSFEGIEWYYDLVSNVNDVTFDSIISLLPLYDSHPTFGNRIEYLKRYDQEQKSHLTP